MNKTVITARVIDQTIQLVIMPRIASGGVDELQIRFDFCSLWDGCGKTAVFYRDPAQVYHIPIVDSVAVVPHEVLAEAGHFYFGVMGAAENIRTTEVLKVKVVQGAITEATANSEPITLGIYAELLKAYNRTEQRVDELLAAQSDGGADLGELVDIRVGEDGTRYPSAGAAVRRQVKDLRDAFTIPGFTVTETAAPGSPAPFQPKAGSHIYAVSTLEPGIPSGEPSPQNPLPITGADVLSIRITTDGEVYEEKSYTADLSQTAYIGTFDWSTGLLTMTHKMQTLTGEEGNWVKYSNYAILNHVYLSDSKQGTAVLYGYCSHLATKADGRIDYDRIRKTNTTKGYEILVLNWGLPDNEVATWTNYLKEQAAAGTPIQILYELDQPLTVQLTPQVISAIGGVKNYFHVDQPTAFTFTEDPLVTMERQQDTIENLRQRVAALEAAAVNNT